VPALLDDVYRVEGLHSMGRSADVRAVSEPHFVADSDRPDRIVQRFLDEVVPGGYLLLSHGTHAEHSEEGSSEQTVRQATALYSRTVEPFHCVVRRRSSGCSATSISLARPRAGRGVAAGRHRGGSVLGSSPPTRRRGSQTTLRGAATALLASRPLWVNSGRWPDGLT
jgi:hypothetical protein